MGGLSEREYREKLGKTKDKMCKKTRNLKKEFSKLEKTKVNLLKKNEEARHDVEREIDKIERKMSKSRDLVLESKRRLSEEIGVLKREVENAYFDLKTRIAETVIPV